MSWQWVVITIAVLAFVAVVRWLKIWESNHEQALELAKELQLKGPQPFWMQRAPQSFEEMLEQMRQGLPETEPPDEQDS